MINLFEPTTGAEEAEAVRAVLASHWLGKGEKVLAFERAWAEHVGATPENVVSTTSCTQALFEACVLAGVGPGDEVIIPTIHFVGAAQAVLATGAEPIFCDVDAQGNATTETILAQMTNKTAAIILNAWGGVMPDLQYAAWPSWIKVIVDLACAPHLPVSPLWDFACWSFDSMKIMTTGDGGMLWCRQAPHAQRARHDFCLGVNVESGISTRAPRWWEFEVERLGVGRHMMNDIQAALGLVQLARLPEFMARRAEIVAHYRTRLPEGEPFNGLYFYPYLSRNRDALAYYLRAQGVYTSFRYWPLHVAYRSRGVPMPQADKFAAETLLLPLHANLTEADVQIICGHLRTFRSA